MRMAQLHLGCPYVGHLHGKMGSQNGGCSLFTSWKHGFCMETCMGFFQNRVKQIHLFIVMCPTQMEKKTWWMSRVKVHPGFLNEKPQQAVSLLPGFFGDFKL